MPDETHAPSKAFRAGELVLLVDRKERHHLVRLIEGGEFHSHSGIIPHSQIIGQCEGTEMRTASGAWYAAWRPTLSDYILKMKRGAQVIYPKDIGAILMYADIAPDAKVFESGVGSGALSLALLRYGADVTGYDISEEFAERAKQNVADFLGSDTLARYQVHTRDAYEAIEESDFERVLLDLPEPWQVAPHAKEALVPGGIILAYTPSIIQASKFQEECKEQGFAHLSTMEVLHRTWHIEGAAVRPDHRMVAHTGFLTRARKPAK